MAELIPVRSNIVNGRLKMKKDIIADLYFPLAFIFGQLVIAIIAAATIAA